LFAISVFLAKAGTYVSKRYRSNEQRSTHEWIPAFAGMTQMWGAKAALCVRSWFDKLTTSGKNGEAASPSCD
jgi:hypothetical protein